MGLSNKLRFSIIAITLIISALTWILLIFNPGHIMTIEHCHVSASGPSTQSLQMLIDMNPFTDQLLGWELMVIAMMLPKLIIPIQCIYMRSLKRYRFPLATIFIFGYLSTWLLAGVFMIVLIIGFNLWMPLSFVPAIFIGLIALLWQLTPFKQYCLNMGHDHWSLPAFGWSAIRNSFLFGIIHGKWCVGSGWALMLFPMLLPQWHNLAMMVVTFIMISEHLEHPRFPKWGFNPPIRLIRAIIAQTKIKIA